MAKCFLKRGYPPLLILLLSVSASANPWLIPLHSLIETDRYQTQYWIEGTKEKPVRINNALLRELNPVLAGRPDLLDPYMDFWLDLSEVIWETWKSPWKEFAIGYLTYDWIQTITNNDRVMRNVGIPRRFYLLYRIRF